MTEEQRRLTLHCHLLVWVYGFNDFASLRDQMDETPGSYEELAMFLSRTIFSQIASEEDVRHALLGDPEPTSPGTTPQPRVPQDPYIRSLHKDLADITRTANTHTCTFTCHKHGHAHNPSWKRRQYSVDLEPKKPFATVAERFTATHRRGHGKINSYHPIIQFCIRSNMDIKALLRDSDARGALFYILNYATKNESTIDALLNALAIVVERIKDETDGAPEAVIAAQLVRSCSAKTVAHQRLGGPAAASKVLGYND
ncbi:unnamed protein product, partial [Pylaiella littoralis]